MSLCIIRFTVGVPILWRNPYGSEIGSWNLILDVNSYAQDRQAGSRLTTGRCHIPQTIHQGSPRFWSSGMAFIWLNLSNSPTLRSFTVQSWNDFSRLLQWSWSPLQVGVPWDPPSKKNQPQHHTSGWWFSHPSEKYESQLGWLATQY